MKNLVVTSPYSRPAPCNVNSKSVSVVDGTENADIQMRINEIK